MSYIEIPKIPFVVAADKIDELLKVKTDSLIDAVNKSKERRKKMIERNEKHKNNVYKKY